MAGETEMDRLQLIAGIAADRQAPQQDEAAAVLQFLGNLDHVSGEIAEREGVGSQVTPGDPPVAHMRQGAVDRRDGAGVQMPNPALVTL